MEEPVERPQATRKRKALMLRERVQVIEIYSTRPRPNYETLAKMFNCGRSQIKNILRQREQIMAEYEKNPDSDRVRKAVPPILLGLNQMVDEWVKRALSHQLPVDEDVIAQKAVQVQKFLNYHEFVPSKLWMRSFKRRHGYYMVDFSSLKVPTNRPKSLKLSDIFEDIRETMDASVINAIYPKDKTSHYVISVDGDKDEDERDMDGWDLSSSDEFPSSNECTDSVVLKDNMQALEHLKPLEEFAMLTDNFRAIGLISQLESIFRARIRGASEDDDLKSD